MDDRTTSFFLDAYNDVNSKITTKMITEFCQLDRKSEELLQDAFKKFKLSVRAYEKILKVARTCADLDGSEIIQRKHIARAVGYRSLDRKYWG